jgi:PPK2 family polyphosphate:nucleotide phosphotransferase
MKFKQLVVPAGHAVKLKDYATAVESSFVTRPEAEEKLAAASEQLADWQAKLYAQNTYALLVILQGLDGAGKDSTIKHVFSRTNPTGCRVTSFKAPSHEELDHDYLWRHVRALPARGMIGVFNRSHYEEVLVVRVHPELLLRQQIPHSKKGEKLWASRFEEINEFESYLVNNGIEVLKFFLHISKAEQKKRFLARLEMPNKNWKFEEGDVAERARWNDYVIAYEDMLGNTSTDLAPWYVVPADQKWAARMIVAETIVDKLASLKLAFPKIEGEKKKELERARKLLESEA